LVEEYFAVISLACFFFYFFLSHSGKLEFIRGKDEEAALENQPGFSTYLPYKRDALAGGQRQRMEADTPQ